MHCEVTATGTMRNDKSFHVKFPTNYARISSSYHLKTRRKAEATLLKKSSLLNTPWGVLSTIVVRLPLGCPSTPLKEFQ